MTSHRVSHDAPRPGSPDGPGPAAAPRGAAVVLLAAAALALINSTVANVAIPAMQQTLQLSPAGVSWALAGWALTYALALIPAGQLGDRFGHRRIFVLGLSLFAAASLATGLARSEAQLVVFRLLQGGAGGMFYPAIAASLTLLLHGAQRGRMFGALGATIGAGAAVGPLLGGVLLKTLGEDWGWRAVLLLNVPLSLAIVAAAMVVLPPVRSDHRAAGFDSVGFVLLTAGLTLTLLPLITGENTGWPGWGWALMAAGIGVTAAFAVWQRHRSRTARSTIVAPSLFGPRDFTLCVGLSFAQFAGFISIFYVLALLWQTGLSRSALEVGFLTLPEAVASILGAAGVSLLTARLGSRGAVILGSVLLSVGVALVSLVLVLVPAESLTVGWLIGPLFVTGLGSGVSISATINHALSTTDPAHAGTASGVLATLQRIGNAVGLAVIGGIFFAVLAGRGAGTGEAYTAAATTSLIVCTAITATGVVLALGLRRPR